MSCTIVERFEILGLAKVDRRVTGDPTGSAAAINLSALKELRKRGGGHISWPTLVEIPNSKGRAQ